VLLAHAAPCVLDRLAAARRRAHVGQETNT
jgi:hypothetical protein